MLAYLISGIIFLGTIVMSNASEPSIGRNDAFARAFADAKAEIETNIAIACKEALDKAKEVPVRYLPDGLEMVLQSPSMWPSNLQSRVAITRAVAEKLAKEHGKAIAPYLLKRAEEASTRPAGETRMLALLALDKLEHNDMLAELSVRLAIKNCGTAWILLEFSFCSEKTREAVANIMVQSSIQSSPRSMPDNLEFLVVAGNEETIELLKKRMRQLEEAIEKDAMEKDPRGRLIWSTELLAHRRKNTIEPLQKAIELLRHKLALPEKEREQRIKDELLFWQTWVGAPRPVNLDVGLEYAVACLGFQKITVSTDFLIEQLKNAKEWDKKYQGESQVNWNRAVLALMFIASQKENRAVPAMVDLAQRIPHFQERVRKTLIQLDTPEAKEALGSLGEKPENE